MSVSFGSLRVTVLISDQFGCMTNFSMFHDVISLIGLYGAGGLDDGLWQYVTEGVPLSWPAILLARDL